MRLMINIFFWLFLRVVFIKKCYFEVLLLGVLVFIFVSFIVDLFICINRISFHWSLTLSLSVLENCLWGVYKEDIRICFPRKFLEGRGKCSGWRVPRKTWQKGRFIGVRTAYMFLFLTFLRTFVPPLEILFCINRYFLVFVFRYRTSMCVNSRLES